MNSNEDVTNIPLQQYTEVLTKFEQQQVLLEKHKARTEQLIEELVVLKNELQHTKIAYNELSDDYALLKNKYQVVLQQSTDKEMKLEETIMELRVQLQVKQANIVQETKSQRSVERKAATPLAVDNRLKQQKKSEQVVSQQMQPIMKKLVSPATTTVIAKDQTVVVKEKAKPKPTLRSTKDSIVMTLTEMLTQEEAVVADNYFRSDEDEYRFADAIQQHLDHKEHAPKILEGNIVTTYEMVHEKQKLQDVRATPYFARMDFKVGNDNKAYYIGKHPVDHYVIPWQSRLAKAFYTLSMEDSFSFNSELTGVLDYRRNIDIEKGKIKYLHEPETPENATNRAVVHRIENKRGKEMEAIVETIQKQQYELISLPLEKSIIVQGSAGSGKSAIALHRLSYILANHKALSENKMAIFTPNEAFLHHIKEVLPSLGHEQIQQFTLPQFISRRTGAKWVKDGADTLLGYKATVEYGEALELDILLLIQQYKPFSEAITVQLDNIDITISEQRLATILSSLQKLPQHKKRVQGKKLLEQQLQKAIEDRTVENVCEFSSTQLTVKNRLYLVKHAKELLVDAFVKQYKRFEQRLVIAVAQQIVGKKTAFERADMAPLLHTYMIVNGKRPVFEYVIVDEAQDYTPYEIWLLNQLTKDRNLMLVGDMGQAIQPYYQPDSWEAYRPSLEQFELHSLTHTYRSTKQIVDEANKIILPLSEGKFEVSTFNPRIGSEVRSEIVQFELLESRIAYWVEEYMNIGYKSFAFVTMDPLFDFALSIPVITVGQYSSVQGEKFVVGDPLELKGLEFDVVFVDELAPFPASDYGKKLKYVAYTRALHQLHLLKS